MTTLYIQFNILGRGKNIQTKEREREGKIKRKKKEETWRERKKTREERL